MAVQDLPLSSALFRYCLQKEQQQIPAWDEGCLTKTVLKLMMKAGEVLISQNKYHNLAQVKEVQKNV